MILSAGSYGQGTLEEIQPFEYQIVEARGTSKRKGVLMSLEGTFQRADTKNANGRVYPATLWDKILGDGDVNERIGKRRMLGELDHPACLTSSDFRILTTNGWKHFREITLEDKVWSIKDGTVCISEVTDVINQLYDGDAYHFAGRNINSGFTANHKFLSICRPDRNKKETYATAAEIADNPGKFAHSAIPKAINWCEAEEPEYFVVPGLEYSGRTKSDVSNNLLFDLETFAAFMGIYLSEGGCSPENSDSVYTVKIYQKNEWSKKFIWDEILSKFHEDLTWRKLDDGFALTDKRLWAYLRKLGDKYTKYIPYEVKNLPANCLEQLVFWFGIGDGRMVNCDAKSRVISSDDQTVKEAWIDQFRNERYVPYTRKDVFTVSERLIRDLHECIVKSGGSGSLCKIDPGSDYQFAGRTIKAENKVPLHQLHISHTKNIYLDPRFLGIEKFHHHGNVYCITVTHGNFYMEQNGKAFWTGNSGATSLSRVSHVVTEHSKEADGRIAGRMDILDTPHGQIAATLFESGCQIGISSRGDGSVENNNGTDEVQNDFRLETYDLVLKPSTPGAFPQVVESEEDRQKNQELIASAVEGLVKGTSDMDVLLECHKIISVLDGCDARCEGILGSIKQKLGSDKESAEHQPSDTEVSEMQTQQVPAPTDAPPGFSLSPEMKDFLQEWVNKGVAEAVAEKEAEIAKLNERIVEVTEKNEDTGKKLTAAEQLIDEFNRKVKELSSNNQTDEEMTKRYDAAVKLLDEAVSRLQEMGELKRRYEAAEELLSASLRRHQEDAMSDAMVDMFDEAGIDGEDELKHYSDILSTCESIDDMKAKFASVRSLIESTEDLEPKEPLPPTQTQQIQEDTSDHKPTQPNDFITGRLLSRMSG